MKGEVINNLRDLRKKKKISGELLAEKANLPLSYIQKIEDSDIEPNILDSMRLARALEAKVEDIFILKE